MTMAGEIDRKVFEYEQFLNDKLKEDLKRVHRLRDQVSSKAAEYLQFKNLVERLGIEKGGPQDFRTMVDLGCNFYCQAKVNRDQGTVFVAVGFGFFVEMTFQEALRFSEKKIQDLTVEAEKLSKQSAQIKAHIKMVMKGLMELQSLNFTVENSRQNIF